MSPSMSAVTQWQRPQPRERNAGSTGEPVIDPRVLVLIEKHRGANRLGFVHQEDRGLIQSL